MNFEIDSSDLETQGQAIEPSMTWVKGTQKRLQLEKGGAGHAPLQSKKAKQSDDNKAFLPVELNRIQNRAFLPDELIEKIVARMGFPAVFKARLLSKSWYIKFQLLSQNVRSLSRSLRNEIVSVSSNWTTYCPVFFNQKHILGYDRASSTWKQNFLDLSGTVPGALSCWSSVISLTSAGSLLCFVCETDPRDRITQYGRRVFVTNVLTKSWQEIDEEAACRSMPDHVRILQAGPDRFMVLVLHQMPRADTVNGRDEVLVETSLYDSSCRGFAWTLNTTSEPRVPGIFVYNSAYLNGRLYCLCLGERNEDPCQLWVHHVTESDPGKAWTAIPHSFGSEAVVEGGVFLCGEKVLVVIWRPNPTEAPHLERIKRASHNFYTLPCVIRVFELNVNTLVLVEVCRGPPATVLGLGLYKEVTGRIDLGLYEYEPQIQYASDADYIYFAQAIPGVPVMTYDVHRHKWDFLPPPCYNFGFQLDEWSKMGKFALAPGLNPFAIVSDQGQL